MPENTDKILRLKILAVKVVNREATESEEEEFMKLKTELSMTTKQVLELIGGG